MKPYKKAKDANHKEICDHLRRHGLWVEETDGSGRITDTITFNRQNRQMGFLEIKKDDKNHTNFTRIQLLFIAFCQPPVGIVKSAEAALEFAREPEKFGLSQKQKDKIAALLETDRRKLIPVGVVERVIGELR